MDNTAVFKLSYGLFLAGVKTGTALNACVCNTAMQVTSEPVRLTVTLQKANYTHDLIMEKRSLGLTILKEDCDLDIIARFGMNSGRNMDKFEGIEHTFDLNGNPLVPSAAVAVLSLNVYETKALGTHTMFFCDLVDAETLSADGPITYDLYRKRKNSMTAPKTEKKEEEKKGGDWICSICHYKYDGEIPFEELPDDWKCPVCGRGKEVFVKM